MEASVEPVPGLRHPEDTGPHASPLRPHIRAMWFPLCNHPRWGWVDLVPHCTHSLSASLYLLSPRPAPSWLRKCHLVRETFQDNASWSSILNSSDTY